MLLCIGMALADGQSIDVDLKENGIVEQQVQLTFIADRTYDSFEYSLAKRPLSVLYDGEYELADQGNGTLLTLFQEVAPGSNTISFTLLYEDGVLENGRLRTFALQLQPGVLMNLSVTIPPGYVLADVSPTVSPKPDRIDSDGRSITMHWINREDIDLILLYEAPSSAWPIVISVTILVIIAGVGLFSWRRKDTSALMDTLSDDEKLVVSLLGKGVVRQKDLCKQTGFSKSKMSKVIRKLEMKKAVKKEPFFKTNKVQLLPGWK
jgi:hypothetical protein